MKQGKASTTAGDAAGARALHTLFEKPVIFDDPYALGFASPRFRKLADRPILRFFVMQFIFRKIRPVAGQVLARARYAEDLLDGALGSGVRQYVIIGAGYDSFALRRPNLAGHLKLFEIDHPDTQARKLEKISQLELKPPEMVEYVAVDFERETVAEGLARSGFRTDIPTFFSWLGTTAYLSREATEGTLRAIAQYAAPGSEIVFDYMLPDKAIPKSEIRTSRHLKKFTQQRGEPLIGEIDPVELEALLEGLDWELIEDLDGSEQEARYFSGRSDGLRPWAATNFAHARTNPAHSIVK